MLPKAANLASLSRETDAKGSGGEEEPFRERRRFPQSPPLPPLLPHPFCLRTRSRRVACVRIALCRVCGVLAVQRFVDTVSYRVVTYHGNGMPSKKKKYNARFPAVSGILPVPTHPIPSSSRNARRQHGKTGNERELRNLKSACRRLASPTSVTATKDRAPERRDPSIRRVRLT